MINNEQNTIIKIFSVLAVALMPPTLVGTIYGMNFKHMPELEWLWGYPLALRPDGGVGGAAVAGTSSAKAGCSGWDCVGPVPNFKQTHTIVTPAVAINS